MAHGEVTARRSTSRPPRRRSSRRSPPRRAASAGWSEPEREIHVEVLDAPQRLVWWWAGAEQPATRVEFRIVAAAGRAARASS